MKAFYVFLSGALLFIVLGLVFTIIEDKATALIWFSKNRGLVADYYFYYITRLGEVFSFTFFAILLWLISWRKMVVIPVLGLIVMLTSFLLKQWFQHERPVLYLHRIGWQGPMSVLGYHMITGYSSFPSGHSMAAWALFTMMAAIYNRLWFSIVGLILAISVSISRVYLMVHFLQDVVVGAMIGVAIGYGVYYYSKKFKWLKPNEKLMVNETSPE